MTVPERRLRVDFQNADETGRVRLNTVGTQADMRAQQFDLADGMTVALVDDELSADGVVRWSDDERMWVAELTSNIEEA